METEPPFAFVVMPIGRPQLDEMYEKAIEPALKDKEFGLRVKRVDKHHEGGILGNHILDFIEGATLIVADLTHGRPNCYLEVGYAFRAHQQGTTTRTNPRVILTAREDHRKDHPAHKGEGADKIHFDLEDYGILWWKDAADFKQQLKDEIRRRLKIVSRVPTTPLVVSPIDVEWVEGRQAELRRRKGFDRAHSEFAAAPVTSTPLRVKSAQLLEAAKTAPRNGYGVGRVLYGEGSHPVGLRDGIHAESPSGWGGKQYWALRNDGHFYRAASLAEDFTALSGPENVGKVIWADGRTREFIESLAHVAHVYRSLGVQQGTEVEFQFGVLGLQGRQLSFAAQERRWSLLGGGRQTTENLYSANGHFTLGRLGGQVQAVATESLEPLFAMFDLSADWPRLVHELVDEVLQAVKLADL